MKNSIVLIFLLTSSLYSQGGWFYQNPYPTGNKLNSIDYINSNTGTAVGDLGTILRTTDGGATWISQSIGIATSLNGVSFSDENNGAIVGGFGGLDGII